MRRTRLTSRCGINTGCFCCFLQRKNSRRNSQKAFGASDGPQKAINVKNYYTTKAYTCNLRLLK
jgi:hypothetical protein